MAVYGGIEAGGTKFVCAVGTGPDDLGDQVRFPTTEPKETIEKAIQFFQRQSESLKAVGIGSFGPVDPILGSPTYGHITSTPKHGWQNVDIVRRVSDALNVPIVFDPDVNAAALGEYRWGAAQGLHTFIYLTIGTGIGGGAMVEGNLLHGAMHPEMGHVRIPHDRDLDPYDGGCPYHQDCLEGLAAGPAIEKRWGARAETLPIDHLAWDLEATYIAYALVNYTLTLAPQRIILGGGVMEQPQLFPLVRTKYQDLLNEYLQVPAILEDIETFIVPPDLGGRAGVLGSIALAQMMSLG